MVTSVVSAMLLLIFPLPAFEHLLRYSIKFTNKKNISNNQPKMILKKYKISAARKSENYLQNNCCLHNHFRTGFLTTLEELKETVKTWPPHLEEKMEIDLFYHT